MKKYWNMPIEEIKKELETDDVYGLTQEQVNERLLKHGKNILREKERKSIFSLFIEQFKDYMVLILIVASIISFFLGETTDASIILAIVILNALLGTVQENKAEKSLEALKKLSQPLAKVIRDGKVMEVEASSLVVGDVVLIEAGNIIPADGRLVEAKNLKVDESVLTGESVPVEKVDTVIEKEDIPLGDRFNLVYMGTTVTYGRGKFIVTATGMDTEMGKVASLIENERDVKTPLQLKLEELGKYLGTAALLISGIMFGVGVLQKRPIFDMFMTAVSLAVAAIPEGLPAIITITLALGVQKMSKKNAIIRKLPAVETLGSTSVICSDKTGTLTQNKMTVVKLYVNDRKVKAQKDEVKQEDYFLLKNAALCTDAFIDGEGKGIGDPTEVAIVAALNDLVGLKKADIEKEFPRVAEIPFDSDRKMMSTIHMVDKEGFRLITKGAPDNIIKRCKYILKENKILPFDEIEKNKLSSINEEMGGEALRVIAVAYKDIKEIPENLSSDEMEKDLIFIGLIGMIDPPRREAKHSVEICKKAGIKPVMITGDHKITASAIARELGILEDNDEAVTGEDLDRISDDELAERIKRISVFARVSPEHKMRIVKAWQKRGAVVAMTGDGVNDAPALKQADIGVAMGITGTDVAKEAADMVLTDDNFATIVAAVEEGRTIFANIKKAIHYLLSCNFGEIVTLFIATILGMPMPLKPVHILWVNLITDSLPALALGFEPPERDIMEKKPRPKGESIFAGGLAYRILFEGMLIGLVTLIAFVIGLKQNIETARTMAFAVLTLSQLAQALNVRSDKSIFKIGLFTNKYMIFALIVAILLQVILIVTPLNAVFGLKNINVYDWDIIIAMAILPLLVMEVVKFFKKAN
ncbi:calcium-transporting P-type ATPase, PMR1-type [Caldanaerobacter subterraneus]|uniref:P-type Ca(2+) transporter n=1 Tax=Caldanaerobacter subterraneus subsp. pacificus DSM 12653 TaxID=391606 RepID=B7R6Q9_9THEO|nr:calcium-transporting P-type ATPase, PMR1-type [Caldanaerobacter subterraneus]KKC28525.1 cation transport ATPase [Caldanaerobacter subterraneus subsp. pacificus DSM 12653]